MNFRYSTPLQLAQRLRGRFRTARGSTACRIAALFLAQPDARLMAAFDLTQSQIDALRPRLQAKVDKYETMHAVEGE